MSPVSDAALEGDLLRQHLHDLGVIFHTNTTLHQIEHDQVLGHTSWGDSWSMSTQGVVLVTQQRSEDSLYRELLAAPDLLAEVGISGVYAIGDAVAPRMPSEAVFDGHRLGREIESQDPMAPSPWLRERPAVATRESGR